MTVDGISISLEVLLRVLPMIHRYSGSDRDKHNNRFEKFTISLAHLVFARGKTTTRHVIPVPQSVPS